MKELALKAVNTLLFILAVSMLSGCEEEYYMASLTTDDVGEITEATAVCGGSIRSKGGTNISAYGICWSTNPNPSIDGLKTIDTDNVDQFSATITGLEPGTTYYARAYATNSEGTAYGNQISFTTDVKDIDGNVYNTITIGNQVWFVENLRTTRYSNGDSIKTPIPVYLDVDSEDEPKYYWAPNWDNATIVQYGLLYTWYAAVDTRGICPQGWHISTDADWETLKAYVSAHSETLGSLEQAIKAIPAGRLLSSFGPMSFGESIYFWTRDGRAQNCDTTVSYLVMSKSYALSLRCVKTN